MHIIHSLHVDLFAGLPGTLFLGFTGALLRVAIVSGVVLYAPFMRKLDFGTVRHDHAARTRLRDLHDMLGNGRDADGQHQHPGRPSHRGLAEQSGRADDCAI